MSQEQYELEREEIASKRFQARDKAFADILNGPDTLTRRWLIGYLEQQQKKAERTKRKEAEAKAEGDGPQRIGDLVTI